MKDFVGTEPLKKAYEYITGNIDQFYNDGVSICFAGGHGQGKSFCGSSILKYACLKNYSPFYTTLADMIASMVGSPFDEQYTARKVLTMADILVIDELDGRHFGKGLSEDLFGRTLDAVVRTRSMNKLPFIYT